MPIPLTARDRGLARGQLHRERIGACLADWIASLRRAGIPDTHGYLNRFHHASGFGEAIREFTPDLLDEVRGLSEGANQPFELLMTAQCMDEEWAFRSAQGAHARDRPEKCSSMAVRAADGAIIVGQNMDLPSYAVPHGDYFEVNESTNGHGALLFSLPTMIGLMGVNRCGVAVCVNSLPQLPSAQDGLPVAFVIRRLLQSRNLDDALREIHALPHATGQHYLIADPTGFCSFEASPSGVVRCLPAAGDPLIHTNHPIAARFSDGGDRIANSRARLDALQRRMRADQVGLTEVKAALSSRDDPDNPVSRAAVGFDPQTGIDRVATVGSMICVLRPGSGKVEVWMCRGAPDVDGYVSTVLDSVAVNDD